MEIVRVIGAGTVRIQKDTRARAIDEFVNLAAYIADIYVGSERIRHIS
jgi:hypothetical protein